MTRGEMTAIPWGCTIPDPQDGRAARARLIYEGRNKMVASIENILMIDRILKVIKLTRGWWI